jgi:hypothetical protein
MSNCASVGEKTVIIIKMHGMYVKITMHSVCVYVLSYMSLSTT